MRRSASDGDSTATAMAPIHQSQEELRWAAQRLQQLRENQHLWIVLQITALLVWIFAMVGTFHCSFLMLERTTESSNIREGLGLFSTSIYDMDDNLLGCVAYGKGDAAMDAPLRAARAFGMMGVLSISMAFVLTSSVQLFLEDTPCVSATDTTSLRNTSPNALLFLQGHRKTLWSIATCLFFGGFLCELMTFIVFGKGICNADDMSCRTGGASILSILNLLLLPVLSAVMYAVPPVATPLFLWRRDIIDENLLQCTSTKLLSPYLEEGDAKFEILSIQPASVVGESKYRGGPVDVDELEEYHVGPVDLDKLDEEIDNAVVMEGIECVAKDHLGKHPRQSTKPSWYQQIIQTYFAMGRHPRTRVIVAVGLCMSWAFTTVGVTDCTFMLVGIDGQDRDDMSGLGLFNRAFYKNGDILGCIAYSPTGNTTFDGPFHIGRAFGVMALIFITTSLISFIIVHGFLKGSPAKEIIWWIATQLTLPVAFVAQTITFASFETQSCTHSESMDCVPGKAGVFAILSAILLFTWSILIFSLSCPKDPFFRFRPTLPKVRSPRYVKSQAEAYKKIQSQKKQKACAQDKKSDVQETPTPEPTGEATEDYSEDDSNCNMSLASSSFLRHPVSCNAVAEEREGRKITAKEVVHVDGSTTKTTIVECGYICGTGKPKSSVVSSRVQIQPATSKDNSSQRQSLPGVTHSWDSRSSADKFEVTDMDTYGESLSHSVDTTQRNSGEFVENVTTTIVHDMHQASTVYEFASTATCDSQMYTKSASSVESTTMEKHSNASSYTSQSCSSSDDGITFDTGNVNYKDQRREGTSQEYRS